MLIFVEYSYMSYIGFSCSQQQTLELNIIFYFIDRELCSRFAAGNANPHLSGSEVYILSNSTSDCLLIDRKGFAEIGLYSSQLLRT